MKPLVHVMEGLGNRAFDPRKSSATILTYFADARTRIGKMGKFSEQTTNFLKVRQNR